jgi:hypothetical protein
MIVCSPINDAEEKLLGRSPSVNTAKVKRKPYTKKPYFCDVPRNIRLPLWSDHDIAGLHRIINKRKLDIEKITTAYWSQKNVRSSPTKSKK